jgi:hypothetical protein
VVVLLLKLGEDEDEETVEDEEDPTPDDVKELMPPE